MIEIEIPKDINKYEAKLIGPFSTRQAACFALAALITVPTFLGLSQALPRDLCMIICIILAMPFILVGWIKPYGMKFEQFMKTAFISNVLAPAKRLYMTDNMFDYIDEEKVTYETMIKRKKFMPTKEYKKEIAKKASTKIKYSI